MERQHALVIGASIAGLLAARILSDYFGQVTVIEQDQLSGAVQTRKGAPQGQHIHLLTNKGANIINEFFPNLFQELATNGAMAIDPTNDFHWFHFGKWKLQFPGPLRISAQSRPLLEYHIRQRVLARSNVRILDGCKVTGFIGEQADSPGIRGIQLRRHAQNEEYIHTNLIVDASGRGSQTPRWLENLGHPAVEETVIRIGVGYASRMYRRPDTSFNWKVLGIYANPPETKRLGYLFPVEGNTWIVTLSGYLHDHPPVDDAGFLEFARSLPVPDLYHVIKDATPLGPIAVHKFPTDRWRHYERSPLPDGLVVLGDAACSFNPIYGQGMTVAALGVQTLRDCLQQQQRKGTMAGFPRSFQKELAKVIAGPWQFTTGEDFRYPEVAGKRSFSLGMLHNYTRRVSNLCESNELAAQTFYEVLMMMKPPTALFHPGILLPALLARHA